MCLSPFSNESWSRALYLVLLTARNFLRISSLITADAMNNSVVDTTSQDSCLCTGYQDLKKMNNQSRYLLSRSLLAKSMRHINFLVYWNSIKKITGLTAQTVVADSKYGTVDNYLAHFDRKVDAHIPDLKATGKGRRKDIFQKKYSSIIRNWHPYVSRRTEFNPSPAQKDGKGIWLWLSQQCL